MTNLIQDNLRNAGINITVDALELHVAHMAVLAEGRDIDKAVGEAKSKYDEINALFEKYTNDPPVSGEWRRLIGDVHDRNFLLNHLIEQIDPLIDVYRHTIIFFDAGQAKTYLQMKSEIKSITEDFERIANEADLLMKKGIDDHIARNKQ